MKWQDKAVILSARKFGESALIVNVLSQNHGLYSGMARGGKSKAARGLYEPGNIVEATWNARLEEHLGTLAAEMLEPVAAAIMHDSLKLAALVSACHLLDNSLWEREPHPDIFASLLEFLDCIKDNDQDWREKYVLLELQLLKRLGFGMDLGTCAATGSRDDLIYVSPKSGRAVCRDAGEKYRDKLLHLPRFVTHRDANIPPADILHGIRLTGYFLDKHIFAGDNKNMPRARGRFVQMLQAG